MRCRGMKPKTAKGGYEVMRNCGKQAGVFFRIKYLKLYVDNGVMEDVFGFCEECAKGKDVPSGYQNHGWNQRQILHLRGVVASVEQDNELAMITRRLFESITQRIASCE